MARCFPGSTQADDVATRFEVPLDGEHSRTLADLFRTLSEEGSFQGCVERTSLESVFLKVIRQNDIAEDDGGEKRKRWWSKRT